MLYLESIISKDVTVSYIVVDLQHIEERLLKDKNILYNFASKILISKLITKADAGDAFIIQAADYIANGLYANYEYNNDIYKNIISKKQNIVQHFPYKNFGK